MDNALFVIMPYKWFGTWVFDDPEKGLMREPFVLGIGEMIDRFVSEQEIENAEEGFLLYFSEARFPVASGVYTLKIMNEDSGGGWYRNVETRMAGWLCPAMFCYFDTLPEVMYCMAEGMNLVDIKQAKTACLDMAIELGLVIPKRSGGFIWNPER